jgi:hypothetical protein
MHKVKKCGFVRIRTISYEFPEKPGKFRTISYDFLVFPGKFMERNTTVQLYVYVEKKRPMVKNKIFLNFGKKRKKNAFNPKYHVTNMTS